MSSEASYGVPSGLRDVGSERVAVTCVTFAFFLA